MSGSFASTSKYSKNLELSHALGRGENTTTPFPTRNAPPAIPELSRSPLEVRNNGTISSPDINLKSDMNISSNSRNWGRNSSVTFTDKAELGETLTRLNGGNAFISIVEMLLTPSVSENFLNI